MYSQMGAGACGDSGLNPLVSSKMRKTFALPRMLYGLEVCNLCQADVGVRVGLCAKRNSEEDSGFIRPCGYCQLTTDN